MTQMLNHETYGDGTGPTVMIAHGLYGSGRNFRSIARRLAKRRQVVCVDMRNHGASFRADEMTYEAMADDLVQLGRQFERPHLIGHSMGGKAAMVAALAAPHMWGSVLVADIAPVPYAHVEETRAFAQTMATLDLSGLNDRKSAEVALMEALNDKGLATFFAQSLSFETAPPEWVLNLPALIAAMDDIVGFPEVSGRFDGPAFFLSGAESDYVTPEGKARARELFPKARFMALKGAGHWLHADQTRAFIDSVDAFLDAVAR